jgi:hypothetical protein
MRERKKPFLSWIGKSIEEIEKEALNKGWEAGFAKACEILHDFADLVCKMRKAQKIYSETFPTGYGCYAPTELESEVDTWIRENYNYFETDYEEE